CWRPFARRSPAGASGWSKAASAWWTGRSRRSSVRTSRRTAAPSSGRRRRRFLLVGSGGCARRRRLQRALVEDPRRAGRTDARIQPLLDDVSDRFVLRLEDVGGAQLLHHAAALPGAEHRGAGTMEIEVASGRAPDRELLAPQPIARLVDEVHTPRHDQ